MHLLDRDLLISICYEHAAHLWKERALHSRNLGKLIDSKRQHMATNSFYFAVLSLINTSRVESLKKKKKKRRLWISLPFCKRTTEIISICLSQGSYSFTPVTPDRQLSTLNYPYLQENFLSVRSRNTMKPLTKAKPN